MPSSHLALTTRVKLAVLAGQIPARFTARDVDRWRAQTDPRQRNGAPYAIDSVTLLSNATVRSADAPPTPNRNAKFLRRFRDEEGTSCYELDPEWTG